MRKVKSRMNSITKVKDLKYERYDIENAKKAFAIFVESAKNASSADDIMKARELLINEYKKLYTMSALAECRYTLNTRDEFYLAEHEYYDEVSPIASSMMSEYATIMLNSPYRSELEKKLPETVYPSYVNAQKSFSEAIIEDAKEENMIVTEYSQLMSQLTTDWRGEKKTISHIRGFLEDSDREVRKAAANTIGNALSSVSDKLDDIYDRLVKVRTRMANKLGYKDFVELGYYRMGRIDYNREMIAKFRENVLRDIVPVVTRQKQKIAKALGIDDFKYYDENALDSGCSPRPSPDMNGILEAAYEMYSDMSSTVTGDFMKRMLEAEAFDIEARDGKWGGGYCTGFELYKQPFILANFNGSADDVETVTHEFGHALAEEMCYKYGDFEASIGSMETAETHSMSMEFFCWKYSDKFFNEPELFKYKHLLGSLSFIPYGVIVDEFQHIVYENPDMTPSERKKAYLELEKKYRPYLNYNGIEYLEQGTRWQYQMHIYETPFYYIDYCLAQVVALEFLVLSLKDYDKALNTYFEHVKRGGRYPFNKLVEMAGLVSPFKEGALEEIAKKSEELIEEKRKAI